MTDAERITDAELAIDFAAPEKEALRQTLAASATLTPSRPRWS